MAKKYFWKLVFWRAASKGGHFSRILVHLRAWRSGREKLDRAEQGIQREIDEIPVPLKPNLQQLLDFARNW